MQDYIYASETRRLARFARAAACVVAALCATARADTKGEMAELKALLLQTQQQMQSIRSDYEQKIDALENRIEELEGAQAQSSQGQAELEESLLEQRALADEVRTEVNDRLSIHGYYDFQYFDANDGTVGSFNQNELSIFLRSSTDDEKWTVFGEIEFNRIDGNDYLSDRGRQSENLQVETAWLEYRHSDRLRVRGGKLLLPQYWQTYHYPNLTLSTLQPLMVGNIFPKSIVAVQVSGDWWNRNERGLSYALYIGNGGDTDESGLDRNDDKTVGGRLTLRLAGKNKPAWLDTLDFSVSGFLGEDDHGRSESVIGSDMQIRLGRFELQAEIAHSDEPRYEAGVFRRRFDHPGESLGYYVQTAYRVSPQLHLFYRYDNLDLDDKRPTPWDEERHTIGINYRPKPNISLKLELFQDEPEGPNDNYAGVASSVVFNF